MLVDHNDDDDKRLLADLAGGDDTALRLLYVRHATPMLRLLRRLTTDVRIAEEVLQESWLAVWQSAGSFRGESSVRGWLLGVARRQAHNRLRRKEVELTPLEDTVEPVDLTGDVEAQVLAAAGHADIMAAIEALSEPLMEVVTLAFVEELSYRDIAEVVGIPIGTVKSRMSHAKKRLADMLTVKEVHNGSSQ